MGNDNSQIGRRAVIKTVPGATVIVASTGRTAATSSLIEANVGYENEDGREAVLDAAETVITEFPFDAMTVELSKRDAKRLATRDDIRYVERNREGQAFPQPDDDESSGPEWPFFGFF